MSDGKPFSPDQGDVVSGQAGRMANELGDAPRVFCVGLSRTGTTSLHLALVALGITSSHYPEAAAWEWLHGRYTKHTTRQFRAYSDLPAAIFYRQLYQHHKDAKFILTTRNLDDWIESTKKHFKSTRPPSQLTIFRDYIRLAAYGCLVYSRDKFSERYTKHNQDVIDFFSDKGNFLHIDIDEELGWNDLCDFLGMQRPDLKFPHARTPYLGELMHVDASNIEKMSKLVWHLNKKTK